MRSSSARGSRLFLAAIFLGAFASAAPAADPGWTDLDGLAPWNRPTGDWLVVGRVSPDPKNPRLLISAPGEGILVNGPTGRTRNLLSQESYGDVEVRFEFQVPRGSNSGVKLEGLYEVQIADSYGVKTPKASDCGGIYPRAELLPRYHHIDEGYPPRVNASRAPGEWQSLEITFRAPRFDAMGKKIADARFEKVVLNGTLVQENVALPSPTGHAWHNTEVPSGPLFLQADHGPVAFRKIRVRRLPEIASR